MKSTSFTVLGFIIIVLLLGGGYLAVTGLKDPASYTSSSTERIGDLHRIETDPQTTVTSPVAEPVVPVKNESPVVTQEPVATQDTLAVNLQKMIDAKVTLKNGSKGPNVGYIQEFMNRYTKKNLRIDNDFGPTLEANVKAFQKATGVTQTGQIGPATLGEMIEWINKNPR